MRPGPIRATLPAPQPERILTVQRHIPPPPELIGELRQRGLIVPGPVRMLSGGRSNLVWQVPGPVGALVLKLYDPGAATPLFANDAGREVAALRALQRTGLAPELVAERVDGPLSWVLYRHLPGAGWTAGAGQVARLLGHLHRQPRPDLPAGPRGSAALVRQTRALLALCPEDGGLAGLEPPGRVAEVAPALIHGDPVPGNIVLGPEGAALIDWQCPALGDPAADLAIFLSPAMQLIYRGAPLSPAEEAACLAAYPDRRVVARLNALLPWFHWRMAAYCQLQAGRGQTPYGAGLALERAALQRSLTRNAR
ncbi:phosphotransferase family protein [Pseudodonghicola flavimaris]|uniref:Aminoglycoside phosphotransferase family protein n=1 Tax=Pseudodonghicola flavimaris TaxID=3050036 RepID=A0ABT7EX48_9RHOB|nr:aminoglycoside phosphotransferase family protein [Pseudodonghicola flavimaris]MDK3016914.1 aminoglycoside phosphotransferase family protein [Pseudodonghicola flavimaris]